MFRLRWRGCRLCGRRFPWLCLLSTSTFLIYILSSNRRQSDNDESLPFKDHNFPSDADYTLETFEFMEKHKQGKAKRTNIVEGPIPMEVKWCWFGSPSFPAVEEIRTNGPDWQTLTDPANLLEMYLYNAYYDTRKGDMFPEAVAVIQVLVMVRRELLASVYCQLWDADHNLRQIVKAHWTEIWQRPWDPRNRFYVPGLLSCPLTIDGFDTRAAPPLPPDEHGTVVCVKGMDFLTDISSRLVEWLEAQQMMGADNILLYTYAVHPRIASVLKYYERAGLVQHIRLTLPGNQPNEPAAVRSRFIWRNRQQKRRNELVPYNDCLLRHVQTHRYVLIVDIDELVVPVRHDDWPQMLADLAKHTPLASLAAYSIRNAFKFDNLTTTFNRSLPDHMWMLRHDRRSSQLSAPGVYSKCFMHTPQVLTAFNHYPLHRLTRNARRATNVDPSIALKLHYKASCPIESADECGRLMADTTRDASLDRFAHRLMQRVQPVVDKLKLLD